MQSAIIQFKRPAPAAHAFTVQDLIELHGFGSEQCRVAIEVGHGGGDPEDSGFAMIYAGRVPWASWAISRSGEHLEVWDCITLADFGRFGSMQAALSALPLPGKPGPARRGAVILPFRPRLAD